MKNIANKLMGNNNASVRLFLSLINFCHFINLYFSGMECNYIFFFIDIDIDVLCCFCNRSHLQSYETYVPRVSMNTLVCGK